MKRQHGRQRRLRVLGAILFASLMATVSAAVASAAAPANTNSPTISGTAKVGEQLTADPGTWSGSVSSYAYQWQLCDSSGNGCAPTQDATAKIFGVRSTDVGHEIRVVVTATNSTGSTNATSAPTAAVISNATTTTTGTTTTTTTTTTSSRNHAPTLSYVSLKRVGSRVYARFHTCDDSINTITVIETDRKAGQLSYARRFAVAGLPCGTHARNWLLAPRFRHGRYTSTLRAVDKSGASSQTVSRSLFHA